MNDTNRARRIEILRALTKPENFRPRLALISRKTGVCAQTVSVIYKQYKEQIELSIKLATVDISRKKNPALRYQLQEDVEQSR